MSDTDMTKATPIFTTSQLSMLLQGARKSYGLTQLQLAQRLGMSQNRLSELESAPGTLSLDQLLALCSQLGLQLNIQKRHDISKSNSNVDTDGDW